jgi:hypothetical protein
MKISKSLFVISTLVIAFASLAACSIFGGTTASNPQQDVYLLKQGYDDALQIAVAYDALPTCTAALTVCSNPPIKVKLKQAKDVASPAIQAAENAVRDPTFNASTSQAVIVAAQQALIALTAITATLPVAKK